MDKIQSQWRGDISHGKASIGLCSGTLTTALLRWRTEKQRHLNSRIWVCSFSFCRGFWKQRHMYPTHAGCVLFSFPRGKSNTGLQGATQALVMSIICTKEWVRTVRTSLPMHSNKTRLVYHPSDTWNSLGGYSAVYTSGTLRRYTT